MVSQHTGREPCWSILYPEQHIVTTQSNVLTCSSREYLRAATKLTARHLGPPLAALLSRPQAPHNPGFLAVILPGFPGYALYPSAQVARAVAIAAVMCGAGGTQSRGKVHGTIFKKYIVHMRKRTLPRNRRLRRPRHPPARHPRSRSQLRWCLAPVHAAPAAAPPHSAVSSPHSIQAGVRCTWR